MTFQYLNCIISSSCLSAFSLWDSKKKLLISSLQEACMTGIYTANRNDSLKWMFLPVWRHMTSPTKTKYNKLWQWVQLLVLSASLQPARHLQVSLAEPTIKCTKHNSFEMHTLLPTLTRYTLQTVRTVMPSQRRSLWIPTFHTNHTARKGAVWKNWGFFSTWMWPILGSIESAP